MRHRLTMLAALLPNSDFKHACLRRLGWQIAPSAWVGPCLVVRVDQVVLGERSRIGPLNVLRDLRRIEFGEGARLGRWNWVSAARGLRVGRSELEATFTLHRESCVTSRHYVDASGGVVVGELATVAGARSTILTHGIDLAVNEQSTAPIHIGRYSLVSGNTKLVPGARVPDYSLVGMGSVVTTNLDEPYWLYTGVPARKKKPLDPESAYFHRSRGPVPPPSA
jgi:carbonic anhydrase/acetyltransferase-like protein (isoleucine patch superfamily)